MAITGPLQVQQLFRILFPIFFIILYIQGFHPVGDKLWKYYLFVKHLFVFNDRRFLGGSFVELFIFAMVIQRPSFAFMAGAVF